MCPLIFITWKLRSAFWFSETVNPRVMALFKLAGYCWKILIRHAGQLFSEGIGDRPVENSSAATHQQLNTFYLPFQLCPARTYPFPPHFQIPSSSSPHLLPVFSSGPTDVEDYLRRHTKKHPTETVAVLLGEIEAQDVGGGGRKRKMVRLYRALRNGWFLTWPVRQKRRWRQRRV